ncbi:hypothetical protein BDZ94DRAFT_818449 [Collybia nuda]|uniref:Uncharacterized protein n=1 Tax=Collybia nuda TaxID=64659 RepID=A0A9P6CGL5_9AGAR|nr:hypothetical protein BDZ94DRAFT_818449 [Collybia nuda]
MGRINFSLERCHSRRSMLVASKTLRPYMPEKLASTLLAAAPSKNQRARTLEISVSTLSTPGHPKTRRPCTPVTLTSMPSMRARWNFPRMCMHEIYTTMNSTCGILITLRVCSPEKRPMSHLAGELPERQECWSSGGSVASLRKPSEASKRYLDSKPSRPFLEGYGKVIGSVPSTTIMVSVSVLYGCSLPRLTRNGVLVIRQLHLSRDKI